MFNRQQTHKPNPPPRPNERVEPPRVFAPEPIQVGRVSTMRPPLGVTLILILAGVLVGGGAHAADRVDYPRQIKPLLAARCYPCHGALQAKGGLRADTA